MLDCLIVGGGVIGLSLAYELACRGSRVRVIDAGQVANEASWAGAGILPPAGQPAPDSVGQLYALSNRLHAIWHERLLDETGIDNGYLLSGGIYLARDEEQEAALRQMAGLWHLDSIESRGLIDEQELSAIEPAIASRRPIRKAMFLPDERQIRNPRHLKALLAACLARGVEVSAGLPAEGFVVTAGRIEGVSTLEGVLRAESFCVTSGAWSRALIAGIADPLPVRPIRGQIVLLAGSPKTPVRIINEGPRYLVPRGDGRVLVGSTEEDVGFDRSTTAAGVEGLLRFALSLVPSLADARLERTWAGLRPGTADGLPYLGRIGEYQNAFVAAGHFRAGLQLSTGTAVVMSRLILGEPPQIGLTPFRVDRHAAVVERPQVE